MDDRRTLAEYYRAKADECQGLIDQMSEERAKREMMSFAKQWRYLAEQAERQGR